ncbi:hypothetical protein SAMN02927923_03701 [Microvirga guangxiensis]|uniref:Uncharacterized protein n=1 Tax=Microvirga guangxiensis TaxID=549386 RepID=A0A1G5KXE3_9HYPH|nr:hypothetical protein SAMN02927923_03701 [Microvirga guangxiensis]
MSIGTEQSIGERRTGLILVGAAVLCLVGAGGLLWWHQGGAIFNDLVLTTLAWCF